jgi:hypothetical protein
MRTIDIFVSSPADVQKERAVAEQSIRSVAAEFNLPIKVSYSDPLRGSKEEDEISAEREDFGDESTFVLRPCFWEHLELEGETSWNRFRTRVNMICHLYSLVTAWSRTGPEVYHAGWQSTEVRH